jgi:hypothetical protein
MDLGGNPWPSTATYSPGGQRRYTYEFPRDCAEDNSNTRGFTGACRASGIRYWRRQRLESPGTERRRALSVLPLGPSDSRAAASRTDRVFAEAGCFLAAASGLGSSHGPNLFADFPACSSRRIGISQAQNHPDSACRGPNCGQQHSILAILQRPGAIRGGLDAIHTNF